jgi:hypothetical protein
MSSGPIVGEVLGQTGWLPLGGSFATRGLNNPG